MPATGLTRPADNEYAQHYAGYVQLVRDADVIEQLQRQGRDGAALLGKVGEDRSRFRYAEGKWTIREVAGHLCDSERVFTYRALTFARADVTPLPPFDENAWAAASNADDRSMTTHVEEMRAVRAATLALFRGFSDGEWARWGTASGHKITVRALAYIVLGHEQHHLNVLRERYGL
ncbi:MAG TPA: DinB family protein [Gemmatimonadaceae bacterium]|nr:DinB family protein [Gemmatimonadaceae bacterium]